jgi:ectoine hydroxylase-related dioxygenase (phytanoyl-CoA dioxygenase family)
MVRAGIKTAKIWLPIYCEPGRNGLIVVPDSHTRSWRYREVEQNGYLKPQLEENIDDSSCVLVETPPGTLLIFNERLLHRGAVNRGGTSRVSVEITMVFS